MQRILIKHPWENFFAGNLKKEDASEFFFFFLNCDCSLWPSSHQLWGLCIVIAISWTKLWYVVTFTSFFFHRYHVVLYLLVDLLIFFSVMKLDNIHAPFGSCSVYLPRTQENYLYLRKEWMGLYMPLIWFIILTTLQHRL